MCEISLTEGGAERLDALIREVAPSFTQRDQCRTGRHAVARNRSRQRRASYLRAQWTAHRLAPPKVFDFSPDDIVADDLGGNDTLPWERADGRRSGEQQWVRSFVR